MQPAPEPDLPRWQLSIDSQSSRVDVIDVTDRSDAGTDAAVVLSTPLAIGYDNVCPGPFRRVPPSEAEIEQAIEVVEDQVMPVLRPPAGLRVLQVRCAALPDGGFVGLTPDAAGTQTVAIDAVEHVFTTLVTRAATGLYRPTDAWSQPQAAAALLILREALHHGGFVEARLAPVAGPAGPRENGRASGL